MKCAWCGKDKPFFEMQPIPLTEEQETYPRRPAKSLVCPKCLGWEKTKIKVDNVK